MLNGKRVQRGVALAAVVFLVAMSLVAAGVSTASDKAAPKPSTLSGEFSFVSHTGTQLAMDTVIKNFKVAYPNIKVNASYLPPGLTFSQPLLARINGGNAPDVYFTNPGPGGDVSAYQLGKAGKLLDLSKRPFVKRIPPAQKNLFYIGKKVYAEPVFQTASGIIYNTTLFKRHGINVPTTFAQLLQACGKAKAAGVSLLALPGLVGNEVMQSMAATFVYGSDPTWNTKRAQGKTTFASSPGWNRVLQRLGQLRDANCFPSGWQSANTSTTSQQLISGQALAYPTPSATIARIAPLTPDWTWASFPVPGDTAKQTRAMLGYNFSMSVSSTVKDKPAALAFIDFIGREGQSRLLARLFGSASMVQVKEGKLPPALAAYAPLIKAGRTVPRGSDVWPTASTFNNLAAVMGNYLTGQQSSAAALKVLDDTWGK
jgi:raffinose/stachyose/melibiose transport system substrate-binding protein